jgi:hypothetical protein
LNGAASRASIGMGRPRVRLAALLLLCCACSRARAGEPGPVDLRLRSLANRTAYIPAQCFTQLQPGETANPCYVCHGESREPQQEHQFDLQLSYDFPQLQAGRHVQNAWQNLFRDRRAQAAAISDATVRDYVRAENYARDGVNLLAQRLSAPPREWDTDGNARWDGYLPDAHYRFDAQGFDRAPDGSPSGWRTFAYYPLPGAFMPTNGSFDDVLIRLPGAFRQDREGRLDLRVYAVNLAIVEALIKRRDVPIDSVDERALGVDLDRDQQLSAARLVRYAFRPGEPGSMQWAGFAEVLRARGELPLAPGLFPEGTEFLHSVRYLDVDARGSVVPAPRMKELRYARKHHWLGYQARGQLAQHEAKEAVLNPDRPEQFLGDAERGLHNVWGWTYQGFIEDALGELRPQSYEETVHCMGCHGGLSVTVDGAFAYPRKLSRGPARGFYHWSAGATGRLPDPPLGERQPGAAPGPGEYASYLLRNPGGDGYRANREVNAKFFAPDGKPRAQAFKRLARDVSELLLPSAQRAWALDKAYWLIVREQSFALGRDALLEPAQNVLREVRAGAPTGIREPLP